MSLEVLIMNLLETLANVDPEVKVAIDEELGLIVSVTKVTRIN